MDIAVQCDTCGCTHSMPKKAYNAAVRRRGSWRCLECARKAGRLNIVGRQFGRLHVLEMLTPDKHNKSRVRCQCQCGAEHIASAGSLLRGHAKSCGCLLAEQRGLNNRTHGMSRSRTYRIWMAMRARCMYPSMTQYERYGGRGIQVCERWHSFENFLADMGEAPPEYQIDRIDNDGNYDPSNCQWADRKTQARNKSTNRVIEFRGERRCLQDWAETLSMDQASLAERLHRWGTEKALTTPKGK